MGCTKFLKSLLQRFWKAATPEDIDIELRSIERLFHLNKNTRTGCYRAFLEPGNIIVGVLFVLQAGNGRIPILTHAEHFFSTFHAAHDSSKMVFFLGLTEFLGSCFFTMIADTFNRKNTAFTVLAVMTFSIVGMTSSSSNPTWFHGRAAVHLYNHQLDRSRVQYKTWSPLKWYTARG